MKLIPDTAMKHICTQTAFNVIFMMNHHSLAWNYSLHLSIILISVSLITPHKTSMLLSSKTNVARGKPSAGFKDVHITIPNNQTSVAS